MDAKEKILNISWTQKKTNKEVLQMKKRGKEPPKEHQKQKIKIFGTSFKA